VSDSELIITMVRGFVGFLLFGASFKSFMDQRPAKVVWGLFAAAVVCITLIPVVIAVFWATVA